MSSPDTFGRTGHEPLAVLVRRAMPLNQSPPPRVLYIAHDLNDPAVHRRVRMFRAGGSEVILAGFRRVLTPVGPVEGVTTFDLGLTLNLKLLSRIGSIARALLKLPALARSSGRVDRIVARNLETLVLGRVLVTLLPGSPKLAYEVLDIHRLMWGEGRASRALRRLERSLAKSVDLLLISSPAFLQAYFSRRWAVLPDARLVENKLLDLAPAHLARGKGRTEGPPWRIGWFGMLRCQKTLDILCRLAAEADGQVEVIIRGRPTLELFSGFHDQIAAARGVTYLGPYEAADLLAHYAEIHLAWAVDYYEDSQNSAWLLPNRMYESLFMGAVPIALSSVETGRWLATHGAGMLIDDAERSLPEQIRALSAVTYGALARATQAVPDTALAYTANDCRALVAALSS